MHPCHACSQDIALNDGGEEEDAEGREEDDWLRQQKAEARRSLGIAAASEKGRAESPLTCTPGSMFCHPAILQEERAVLAGKKGSIGYSLAGSGRRHLLKDNSLSFLVSRGNT